MSAGMGVYRDEMDVSYAVDFGRDREPTQKRSRHPEYRRKGSAPARVNGIHCRRSKRWTWGSGRGARIQNMRAFASCLALALATSAMTAFGITIDMKTIGNAGNPSNSSTGLGAVGSVFRIATTETTNAQYVAFLNSVDPTGANTRSLWNSSMSTGLGGISRNTAAPVGSRYSSRTGAPAGAPAGTSYANMPVNFVTWFSAARFANWLNNGASGTSSTETGAYTLNGTSVIPARNPGAQFFLPSQNEWYKAAFYTGTGSTYTLYQTNSNTAPLGTGSNFGAANAANYNSAVAFPVKVGSFTNNSTSAYGLFDMLGNVAEMTDNGLTGTSSSFRAFGGSWGGGASTWNANAAAVNQLGTFSNQSYGFRVAAVPEPGTIALAGMGIAGLAGLDWMKRRKKRLAARQTA